MLPASGLKDLLTLCGLEPAALRIGMDKLRRFGDFPDLPLDLNPLVMAFPRVRRGLSRCRVAARLFDEPQLAALIFPPPAPQSAPALLERCDQLIRVLAEFSLDGPSAPA